MLQSVVESLYNTKGIFKNTSINTLQSLKPTDYPTFSDVYVTVTSKLTSMTEKTHERTSVARYGSFPIVGHVQG